MRCGVATGGASSRFDSLQRRELSFVIDALARRLVDRGKRRSAQVSAADRPWAGVLAQGGRSHRLERGNSFYRRRSFGSIGRVPTTAGDAGFSESPVEAAPVASPPIETAARMPDRGSRPRPRGAWRSRMRAITCVANPELVRGGCPGLHGSGRGMLRRSRRRAVRPACYPKGGGFADPMGDK
jgi:hypothetical protein